jgi:hypothetical protein
MASAGLCRVAAGDRRSCDHRDERHRASHRGARDRRSARPGAGIVFGITPAELAAADADEVADVKRVTVRLRSGIAAFLYVGAAP